MKIIVCTKQICHTYARTGMNPDTEYINSEDSIFRVNPHDEAATELALRLRETIKDTKVNLLTLGSMISEDQLRRCLATGADNLYQVDFKGHKNPDPFFQPDPRVKADLISRTAKVLGADLILCGKESLDRTSGQVGALVAGKLNLPFVSGIIDLSFDKKTHMLRVKRSAGRGVKEIIECSYPAVFSVGLGPELRLPTIEKRQLAQAYEIRTPDINIPDIDIPDIDIPDIDTPDSGKQGSQGASIQAKSVCTKIFQPRPRSRIIPVPDSNLDAFDRVLQLLTGSRVEKKGELLTGSTTSQVEGIINFLKENQFIESETKSI
jgi:electron transfer flavoprotein beta subunit